MEQPMKDIIITKEWQKLYEFWESLPAVRFLDIDKKVIQSHPCRSAVLRTLREGVLDDMIDGQSKRRYALSVGEIKHLLDERENIKISSTNLYFHLNILEEAGLIKTVTTILKGPYKRNKTKFFGRVARHLFVRDPATRYTSYEVMFREFEKFAKLLELKLPQNFLNLATNYVDTKRRHEDIIGNWLVGYEALINQANLDISELFEFLKFIDIINPKYVNGLNKVLVALQEKSLDLFSWKSAKVER